MKVNNIKCEVKSEASVERQTRATGEGALRKFLSKKRNESEKFSDSKVCDKIQRFWLPEHINNL